jgi:hypothetical protein
MRRLWQVEPPRRGRWRAVRTGEADVEDPPKVLFVCPDCADFEFD